MSASGHEPPAMDAQQKALLVAIGAALCMAVWGLGKATGAW